MSLMSETYKTNMEKLDADVLEYLTKDIFYKQIGIAIRQDNIDLTAYVAYNHPKKYWFTKYFTNLDHPVWVAWEKIVESEGFVFDGIYSGGTGSAGAYILNFSIAS